MDLLKLSSKPKDTGGGGVVLNGTIVGEVAELLLSADSPWSLSAKDDHIFLGCEAGPALISVDVTDPLVPVEVNADSSSYYNYPRGQVVLGNSIFVLSQDRMVTMDASDMANPARTNQYYSTNIGLSAPGAIYGGHMLVQAGKATTKYWILYDMTDPNNPAKTFKADSNLTYTLHIAVDQEADPNVAFLCGAAAGYRFSAYRLNEHATPVPLDFWDAPGQVSVQWSIVRDGYAYISANGNFFVVNVTDPTNMFLEGTVVDSNVFSACYGMAISGNIVIVTSASRDAITLIDVSDPTTPVITAFLKDTVKMDNPHGAALIGKYLFVGLYSQDKLKVIELGTA